MYHAVRNSAAHTRDVTEFIETINSLENSHRPELRKFFDPQLDVFVARAPGRLDVMGGIADYSGSLVLEMPIQEATLAAVQLDPARRIILASLSDEPERESFVEISFTDFESDEGPVDYHTARERFNKTPARHWAAYVAGAFVVLTRERNIRFAQGARILISSKVPEGKGVSSSAALEVAAMQALTAAFEIAISPRHLAMLCQMVENLVAGAPCGVMDQMTAVCGEEGRLLALLCQPAEIKAMINIPDELAIWGLDSGERHSVGGADYGAVRVGAFMGYRMIAEMSGLKVREVSDGMIEISDQQWGGYLSNVTPEDFEQLYAAGLPEQIAGADFLSRFGGTTDLVARIDPRRTYAVRVPTSHPIYEHHRIKLFADMIAGSLNQQKLEALGDLMYQSHASYSACGLGSAGTDLLVSLVRDAGAREGLFGARITGGGSGGTVAVLGHRESSQRMRNIAHSYAEQTGYQPYVFSGSSPGSAAFGHLLLKNREE
jgi:galactokinase